MARDRILSQAKAKLILESLAPLNATVMQRVRKLLNEWIELSGGDPLAYIVSLESKVGFAANVGFSVRFER